MLCAAHHGSDTSSSEVFLETVKQMYAIISVGENNVYGHPSDNVVKRLEKYTETDGIYRTDLCGAVRVRFGSRLNFGNGEDIRIWQKRRKAA